MHGNRDSIPVAYDAMGVVGRAAEWGEMNVAIESLPGGLDTAPVFAGLPDDRCQCPHWGYVVKGTFRVRYADREETLQAGDSYHLTPGHTCVFDEDTEIVEFSPKGEYQKTLEVVVRNVAALMAAGAPH